MGRPVRQRALTASRTMCMRIMPFSSADCRRGRRGGTRFDARGKRRGRGQQPAPRWRRLPAAGCAAACERLLPRPCAHVRMCFLPRPCAHVRFLPRPCAHVRFLPRLCAHVLLCRGRVHMCACAHQMPAVVVVEADGHPVEPDERRSSVRASALAPAFRSASPLPLTEAAS